MVSKHLKPCPWGHWAWRKWQLGIQIWSDRSIRPCFLFLESVAFTWRPVSAWWKDKFNTVSCLWREEASQGSHWRRLQERIKVMPASFLSLKFHEFSLLLWEFECHLLNSLSSGNTPSSGHLDYFCLDYFWGCRGDSSLIWVPLLLQQLLHLYRCVQHPKLFHTGYLILSYVWHNFYKLTVGLTLRFCSPVFWILKHTSTFWKALLKHTICLALLGHMLTHGILK